MVLCINYVCIVALKSAAIISTQAGLIGELDDSLVAAALASIETIPLKFEIGSNMNNINQASITARVSLFLLIIGSSVSNLASIAAIVSFIVGVVLLTPHSAMITAIIQVVVAVVSSVYGVCSSFRFFSFWCLLFFFFFCHFFFFLFLFRLSHECCLLFYYYCVVLF